MFSCWYIPNAYADFNSAMLAYQQEDYSLAMTRLRPLAELGNADAQYNIGVMYLRGQGLEQDWVEAYAWIALAAENNNAKYRDIKSKLLGKLTATNRDKAIQHSDELIALYGYKVLNEKLVPKLSSYAVSTNKLKIIRKITPKFPLKPLREGIQGWADIEMSIALDGSVRDVTVVDSIPVKEFGVAAARAAWKMKFAVPMVNDKPVKQYGHRLRASFKVKGAKTDEYDSELLKIRDDLLAKATANDAVAQYNYAYLMTAFFEFNQDERFSISEVDANQWYLKAARSGLPQAQYMIGRNAFYGVGYEKDGVKGELWLNRAAQAGYPLAQSFLGHIYSDLDAGPDYSERAVYWLKQAVANEHVPAMIRLAWLMAVHPDMQYRDGQGALELAETAKSAHEKNPVVFEALAAAHAELGDFKKAVKWQREAIAKARKYGWNLLLLNDRLQHYKARKAWRGL